MFDVLSLGELLVDFTESGLSPDGMRLFEQNAGGAVANVAGAAARLGAKAAFIGKVGDDMHGAFLKETLQAIGIDTCGLIVDGAVFTTLAFVALEKSGERAFSFARKPGADTCLHKDEIDTKMIERTKILHVGSLSLTDEPAREATLFAIEHAKKAGKIVSYDPNYRASLWKDEKTAIEGMRSILGQVDIMKLSDEEMPLVTDTSEPEAAAKKLLEQGVSMVAITLGKQGSYVATNNGGRLVAGFAQSNVVDTTGAGDAFFGGFLYGFLRSGMTLGTVMPKDVAGFARIGNATAALCITKRGGIPAMPTWKEVMALLG